MTLFIFAFGLLAIVALFWCLRGFTRELKRSRRMVGMVVRVETIIGQASATNHAVRNTENVIAMTRRAALHSGRPA